MRYQGQNYEQDVPLPDGKLDEEALRAAYAEYGRLYEGFYGYRLDGISIELVRLSVIATGEAPTFARLPGVPEPAAVEEGTRDVFFPDVGYVPARILRREALAHGTELEGPGVVEFMDSTAVVPPDWTLRTRDDGILEVTR
jgi:N-methylhydantoinase A